MRLHKEQVSHFEVAHQKKLAMFDPDPADADLADPNPADLDQRDPDPADPAELAEPDRADDDPAEPVC